MNQLVIRSLTFADVRAFLIWEQRVASSNPAAPTNKIKALQKLLCKAFVQYGSMRQLDSGDGYTSLSGKKLNPRTLAHRCAS